MAKADPTSPELAAAGRAARGDRAQFDALVAPHIGMVRGLIRRMIAHPDDTDELVQETLLSAYEKIGAFRGEAKLSTWLCSIATRLCLDYLRGRKRWRPEAQIYSKEACHSTEEKLADVKRTLADPGFIFDAREHIAYCFTCVARTLEPEEEAALIVRDVLGCSNDEAARIVGVSESVLRHRLSSARKRMQSEFENLCALVNKQGACWQCPGLREFTPEQNRGEPVPDIDGPDAETKYRRRLAIVRDADVDRGRSQTFHDLVWRVMARTEEERSD